VWLHRGVPDTNALERAYAAYTKQAAGPSAAAAAPGPTLAPDPAKPTALPLQAEAKWDRLTVWVAGSVFTEYLFGPDTKYPYFFPLNGPRTGRSVTARQTEPYPHHSSLFFGCDRVNGGNYWQEGLERGRIVSKAVRMLRAAGDHVALEQDCRWERPGADAPFDDLRRIAISAPATDVRLIDFDITLTARTKVRIEKTNHSLFSARVAPELSVQAGGSLRNAHGDAGETGAFGRAAPWADYRGQRDGEAEGLAILCHPANRWFPPQWFMRDYGFMSPTPMYWLDNDVLDLAPGESLRWRYRVIVHGGAPAPAQIEAWYREWSEKGTL
jgi:hypothetical protein